MAKQIMFPADELDDMRCVYDILLHTEKRHGEKTAYRQIEEDGEETSVTFPELAERVNYLRAVLLESGMKGKHFAIVGETSIEWISLYLAIISGVGVCVPIDKELNADSIIHQLNHADVDMVFVSKKNLNKIKDLLAECPNVKTLVVMRGTYENSEEETGKCGYETKIYDALVEEGKNILTQKGEAVLPNEINADDACLIIYTSGTTGSNKGVVLSNRNVIGTLRGCRRLLWVPETCFSVLPVNHSYELHANLMSVMYCGTCVCINDEMRYILKNLKRFKPEMSCMVPMMLDTIVRELKKEIKKSGKQKSFESALKLSNALRKIGIDKRRVFFKEILDFLGGNLKMIVCGGAFLDQNTADFLTNIGIEIYNGYGITECSPVVAVNAAKLVKRGSVGRVLPTAEVRIADKDENGNGEIQVRGDIVMLGYYKAEEDTTQVFTEDGWFRTGDLGYVDKDRFLYLSGRIKNLIILPNGKNIYPEEIEDALMKKIPYIKECVVFENNSQSGLYAHVYPDMDFCAANGLSTRKEIKEFMKKDMDAFNRGEPGYKRISDYDIQETEFEKNTTHKILRYKLN